MKALPNNKGLEVETEISEIVLKVSKELEANK